MTALDTFLSTVTVFDTETTNLHPAECEIVEIAAARYADGNWKSADMLLGAYNGIPPEASAKNNISQRMIDGKPKFDQVVDQIKSMMSWSDTTWLVAHNSEYDRAALFHTFTNIGLKSDAAICDNTNKWICTWRLSKQILHHDFGDVQYGLNYLRYKLDLPIPDDLTSHRANADTLICAELLKHLVTRAIDLKLIDSTQDIGTQLHNLCWGHIPVLLWPFGKHKGQTLDSLTNDYYLWALSNVSALQEKDPGYDNDLAESVRLVLEQRLAAAA